MLTAQLIRIDQFEHKMRTGFYLPMVRQALRNIKVILRVGLPLNRRSSPR